MKRQICGLLSALLILGLAACASPLGPQAGQSGGDGTETPYAQPLKAKSAKDIGTAKDTSTATDTEAGKDYRDGVINAARLTIKNDVAFWGFETQLCSALLDENKDLYDFISEGNLSAKIYSIALDDSHMYMATEDGLVRIALKEFYQDQSMLSVIDDHSLSNSSFQIYGDNIYFTYGRSLYRVPKEGGKSKVLEENIEEFQVTTEGIYCLNKKGDLIQVSLDGKERKTLAELGSEGDIFIFKDKAYITTGDDKDYIFVYDLAGGSYEKLHFEKDLTPYHPVWVTDDSIYYESDDYDIYRYDIKSGTEVQSPAMYDLPDYDYGYLQDGVMYYVFSDYLYWMNLDSGKSVKLGKGDALKYGASSGSTEKAAASGDYNIAEELGAFSSEGQARLESKYFSLFLPAGGDLGYEVINERIISIYYRPAYESGNGGLLVSIEAYDWGDNSYENLPSYTIAGVSEDKKYIAIFPTDVQFDTSQQEGYYKMFKFFQRIDSSEGKSDNNPFFCKD